MMCKQSLESSMSHQQVFNHVTSPAIPLSSLHKCALGWGQGLTFSWLHFVCYSKAERCAVKSVCVLKPVGKAPIYTAWLPLKACCLWLFNPSFTSGSKLEVIYPCARMKWGDLCLFFFPFVWNVCGCFVWNMESGWEGGGERKDLEPFFAPFLELGQLIRIPQVPLRIGVPVLGLWWWCLGWEMVLNSKMGPKQFTFSQCLWKREEMWVGMGKTQGWACIRSLLQKVELRGLENAM